MVDKLCIKMLKEMKPPYTGIVIDITENPSYIGLRVYENQIMSLSDEKRYGVMMYLHEMRKVILQFGYKCFFEGAKGDPPRSI
jgi:hypothetical protein